MSREKRYTFLKKKVSKEARFSMVLTLLSVLLLAASVVVSAWYGGQGGLIVGALGLLGALFALYAFIVAIRQLVKREDTYMQAGAATILSGIMTIGWLSLILWGLS
ncbi:MAG: hypothetical protein U0L49_10015 [Eubacterium sp.]|nr:hypothetical protein [Eubacterium sp.]